MDREQWVAVPDDSVRHVWCKADDDLCGEDTPDVEVPPYSYADAGTPICGCGADMAYVRTEVRR
jgi:hypothetical protein